MSTQNALHTILPMRGAVVAQEPVQPKKKKKNVAAKWEVYFGTNDNDLEKWKKLCRELGKESDTFTSKNQCKKALKGVWVNIHDFLDAIEEGKEVRFFKSESALADYTLKTHKVFPRRKITKGSPLRELLAHIL